MTPQTIESRVDRLEERVTEPEQLPERVTAIETQIVQLRAELRVEFSAVREEMRAGDDETRRVLGEQIAETRRRLDERIAETQQLATEQTEETRRFMRVLHEDVIGRLATIPEVQSATRRDEGKTTEIAGV
jgi:F0F1-type ATP synthase membrane subunit b/b'